MIIAPFAFAQTQSVMPTLPPGTPTVKFARTTTLTPGSAQTQFGILLDDAYRLAQNKTNTAGIMINGTLYLFEQYVLNDGADCNTMLLLYEYMIQTYNVTFMLAPTGFDCQRLALLAEKYGIVYLNGADAQYQRVAETNPDYQNLTMTFTTVADYHSTSNCFKALADLANIQRFVMAANPEVPDYPGYVMSEVIVRNGTLVISNETYSFLKSNPSAIDYKVVTLIDGYALYAPDKVIISQDVVKTAQELPLDSGLTMLDYSRFSLSGIQAALDNNDLSLEANCTYFDSFITKWLDMGEIDAWVGTASAYSDQMMLCFNRRKFHPPYFWHWAAVNAPAKHAWQYEGSFAQDAWEASADFADPLYGSTQQYNSDLKAAYGFPGNSYMAQQSVAFELAWLAVNATQSLDPQVIAAWLRNFRGSTIINSDYHFIPGTQQAAQQRLCFQTVNGTRSVVYPTDYANAKPIVLNPTYDTSAFYEEFPQRHGLTHRQLQLAIALPVTAGGIILIILAIVGLLYYKYHLVFIEKKNAKTGGNWDDDSRSENTTLIKGVFACLRTDR